jgi:hypothetical protein
MTSALDIAHDVMIPSLEGGLFRRFIMCLCPFSVRVIGPPLTLCGLQGYLVGYDSGNCADYEQWLLADDGIKPERTALHTMARSRIITWLEGIAAERAREGRRYSRFSREGNIYVPMEAAEVELPAPQNAV